MTAAISPVRPLDRVQIYARGGVLDLPDPARIGEFVAAVEPVVGPARVLFGAASWKAELRAWWVPELRWGEQPEVHRDSGSFGSQIQSAP